MSVTVKSTVVRKPFLLTPKDRGIQARQSNDLFKLSMSSITYFIKEGSDTEPEDLMYLESSDQELVLGKRYNTRAFVRKTPLKTTLKKFGIEEKRDIQVEFRKDYLRKKLLPEPTMGSFFIVEKELYHITETSNSGYTDHYSDDDSGNSANIQYVVLGMKIKNSTYNNFDVEEDEKLGTLFFGKQDVKTMSDNHSFLFKKVFAKHIFIENSIDENVDLLYLENLDKNNLPGKRYELPAFVLMNPTSKKLSKFGVYEERDLQIELSYSLSYKYLKRDDIKIEHYDGLPDISSIMIFHGEPYIVLDSSPQYYNGNTEVKIGKLLFAKKLKNSIFKDGASSEQAPEEVITIGSIDPYGDL